MPVPLTHPWALGLLAALPVLATLTAWANYRRRRVLARFGRPEALAGLAAGRPRGRRLARFARSLGLALLVLGIAGPQWGDGGPPSVAVGRDVVVLLDLSHRMLAHDVVLHDPGQYPNAADQVPSRLNQARHSLRELADAVQRHGGHRLGLVVFAADGLVVCPLTLDYDHFRAVLADIDADTMPNAIQPRPGAPATRMGKALEVAVKARDDRFPGYQDVLLFSDGDDPIANDPVRGDREWEKGVRAAREAGVRVFAVGLGDPNADSPVPGPDGKPWRPNGREVRTRLHEAPLEAMAASTGGAYLPARREPPPLAEFCRTRIEPLGSRELSDDALPVPRSRAVWLFAPALLLWMMALLLDDRAPKPRRPDEAPR